MKEIWGWLPVYTLKFTKSSNPSPEVHMLGDTGLEGKGNVNTTRIRISKLIVSVEWLYTSPPPTQEVPKDMSQKALLRGPESMPSHSHR